MSAWPLAVNPMEPQVWTELHKDLGDGVVRMDADVVST